MKKLLAVLLVSLLVLTGCGKKDKIEYADSYSYVFSTDIDTLDYTYSMDAPNADHTQNFMDGLLELNNLGRHIPSISAMPEISEDNLTYTFKLRDDVKWVRNTGEEYGNVTAKDFVFGLKHAIDKGSEMDYIVIDSIAGLADYVADPKIGFDKVGIKAEDDTTLVITLAQPEDFFVTKLNYGIMFPINEEFVNSIGVENFGTTDPASILYNGPYILTNNTSKSVIEYKANELYWDKDNVHVKDVKLTYYEGEDQDLLYRQFAEGNFTQARVFPNSAGYKEVIEKDKDNIIVSQLDGTVFNFQWNVNRQAKNVSKKTDAQHADFSKAVMNRNFRLAVMHGFDRGAYNAQSVGDDLKYNSLRNDFLPPEFVSVSGVDYPKLVLEELNKLDKDQWDGVDLSDGQDAFFNVEKAKAHVVKAKEALTAEGVTFPIVVDIPTLETSEVGMARVRSFKQSVETSLGSDFIEIVIHPLSRDAYLNAAWNPRTGAGQDYDISNISGWGPDYIDPQTYLDIYLTDSGAMVHKLGLERVSDRKPGDKTVELAKELRLDQYDTLIKEAIGTLGEPVKRAEIFAKADALFVDTALQIPVQANGGTPFVTKVVPFTRPFGWAGNGQERFKYMKIQTTPVTQEQHKAAKEAWEKARTK